MIEIKKIKEHEVFYYRKQHIDWQQIANILIINDVELCSMIKYNRYYYNMNFNRGIFACNDFG